MHTAWLGSAVISVLAMVMPLQLCAADVPNATPEQMLVVTNEMWRLLCGVVNKETADLSAARFGQLVKRSWQLSETMFESEAQDVESLNAQTYRIAEVYEEASYEFESLCKCQCYGSAALVNEFLKAMELGVFGDEEREKLQLTHVLLSSDDAQREIARLRRMEALDDELLEQLGRVQDAQSAEAVAEPIATLAGRMKEGRPAHRFGRTNMPENARPDFLRVCNELEPILWKIRNEIVRIVALDGYDREPFDTFSDALDSVYESMSLTHGESFDNVFDSSFRMDLDDALHGNIITKP